MDRTSKRLIILLLAIVVIILINVASTTLFSRTDLTRNGTYSLSRASMDAVATLEEPLTIKAFLSPNLPAPYNNTQQTLRDLLEEYAIAGNRFFNYEIVTVPSKEATQGETSPEEEEARRYRIYPIQVQNVQQDEVKLLTAFMGIAIIHGDMLETVSAATASANLEFQITNIIDEMSKKISALLAMRENIEITLVLSDNLNALSTALRTLPEDLEASIAKLNSEFYGRLDFDYIDPIREGISDVRERYGANPLTLRTAGGSSETAWASIVLNRGDQTYTIEILSRGIFGLQIPDVASLEETIGSVAESLIGIQQEVGFMTGYGTPALAGQNQQQAAIAPLETDLRNFETVISTEYSVREINLDEERIPDGLSTLIVVSPREKLSDFALYQLDQFVLQGNNLVLFLDSHSVFMPQSNQYGQSQDPVYIPRTTGLEELIKHHGLELQQAYVLDEKSFVQRQQNAQGGIVEAEIYFAPIIGQNERNTDIPVFKNLPDMVVLNMSPVVIAESEAGAGAVGDPVVLFSTSADGWTMEGDGINLSNPYFLTPPPDEDQRSIPMAYSLEGMFQSYFAGRAIPDPPAPATDDEAGDVPIGTIDSELLDLRSARVDEGAGRLIVIGGSAMIGSNVLDAEGNTGNAVFLLNLLDELAGREDYAIMRTKGQSYIPLDETTVGFRNFMKLFNIAGLPTLIIIIGIGVWLARSARKRTIEALFAGSPRGEING
jgi:ABC-2 type transport system permease protein